MAAVGPSKFTKGDLVFAKVRGHSAWPARVARQLESRYQKYEVQFFGANEFADVNAGNLFAYNSQNIAKFGTRSEKSNFLKAMKQIAIAADTLKITKTKHGQSSEEKGRTDNEEDSSVPQQEMVACQNKFKKGDLVFTKVRGHPFWPSKVDKRLETKSEMYGVIFLGTNERANVKVGNIIDYNDENIAKYGNISTNEIFLKAMQEIATTTAANNN